MANDELIKSKTAFTIKKKRHHSTFDSDIFERDYMTLNSLGGWEGQTFPNAEGNFRVISPTNGYNYKRKHKHGKWLKADDASEIWTLDNVGKTAETSESKITLSKKHSTLLDFCYYGSCRQLIESSVRDIIAKFPADMHISDFTFKPEGSVLPDNMVVVSNPYLINIKAYRSEEGDNKLRFFCDSFDEYDVYDKDWNFVSKVKWEIPTWNKRQCKEEGECIYPFIKINDEISFQIWLYGGEEYILAPKEFEGYTICPCGEAVVKAMAELDDFERLMVNRETEPIFSMVLDYPHETEQGVVTYLKTFTWPSQDGWNPDIETFQYEQYINSLLKLADFYDEYYTDNLWRSLTHDAIKNMDKTLISSKNEDAEDFELGTSKMQGLFWAYGRLFDEIKRYIDNIKHTNEITYGGENNLPDYFLTDSVELSGWDVSSSVETLNETSATEPLFTGDFKNYDYSDANIQFLKELKLNSKSIISRKGTKAAIEELLSLFGMISKDFAENYNAIHGTSIPFDYIVNEYVTVAGLKSGMTNTELYDMTQNLNSLKGSFSLPTDGGEPIELELFQGLPVRIVSVKDEEGNEEKYLIPWFSREDNLDGNPYFQMYGGWGAQSFKEINVDDLNENTIQLFGRIFEETEKYLKSVNNVDELRLLPLSLLDDGTICYVANIDEEEYTSNYFILKDKELSNIIGKGGWENIPLSDIEDAVNDGIKVLYLESLIDTSTGNNPHCGYGKYDSGQEYLDYFRHLFKNALKTNDFSDEAYDCDGKLNSGFTKAGFELYDNIDNVKCWYFTKDNKQDIVMINADGEIVKDIDVKCGEEEQVNHLYTTELKPFDFEQSISGGTESESYSLINNKSLSITFVVNDKFKNDIVKYVLESILPYLKQLIPSTCIWRVNFGKTIMENNNLLYIDDIVHAISLGDGKVNYNKTIRGIISRKFN